MFIQCKHYRHASNIFVMVDKIIYWEKTSVDGIAASRIFLMDGCSVLVGNDPAELGMMVDAKSATA